MKKVCYNSTVEPIVIVLENINLILENELSCLKLILSRLDFPRNIVGGTYLQVVEDGVMSGEKLLYYLSATTTPDNQHSTTLNKLSLQHLQEKLIKVSRRFTHQKN